MNHLLSKISCLTIFSVTLFLNACGAREVEESNIKDYRFYIDARDEQIRGGLVKLINEYNSHACAGVLKVVEQSTDANSTIEVVPGIEARDGKIGWGQWEKTTTQDETGYFSAEPTQVTNYFSMKIQFDEDYVVKRINFKTPQDEQDVFTLLMHETGHGLEMGHNPNDVHDVMYPNINGTKDANAYFQRVRTYMRDQPEFAQQFDDHPNCR